MKKLLKAKRPNGKWWTYFYLSENQWGNEQASAKITPELKEWAQGIVDAEEGSYINLLVFEDKREPNKKPASGSAIQEETQEPTDYSAEILDDDLPF